MNEKPVMIIWFITKITPIILSFCFLCLCVRQCVGNSYDIDNEVTDREIFTIERMVDTTGNGFELVYATKKPVTKSRLNEMTDRQYIFKNIDSLKSSTIIHFPDLIYTDIYDYAEFALQYEIDTNLVIEEISVYGDKKSSLYIGENPQIPNSARWYNPNTQQGLQYIKRHDIYYRRDNERIYRYKKCSVLFDTSETDEHFSHFSEDERIK